MSVEIQTTFGNAALPVVTPLADQIAAIPGLAIWAQADAAHLVLSGANITTWLDRAGGVNTLHRYVDASRAEYAGNQIAGYPAAIFRGTDTNADGTTDFYTTAVTLPTGAPYTMVAVFKRTANTTVDTLIAKFTDASNRAILQCEVAAANVSLKHGTSTLSGPINNGAWNYVIAAFTGSTLLMNVNGVDVTPVTAVGSMGTGSVIVGALAGPAGAQALDGAISDVMIFNADVLSNATYKAALIAYFDREYGL